MTNWQFFQGNKTKNTSCLGGILLLAGIEEATVKLRS